MLFRFTIRSTDAHPRFDPSAFVLPFAGHIEAHDFGAEMIRQFDKFGTYDRANGIAINVTPVAYGAERPAGRSIGSSSRSAAGA
jgi:hypothetical protein